MTIAAMTADSTGLTGGTAVVTQQQAGLPVGSGAVSATAWTEPNGIRGGLWRALDWDNNGNHNFAHFKPTLKTATSRVGLHTARTGRPQPSGIGPRHCSAASASRSCRAASPARRRRRR
jgi:hypothetical protein